MRFWENREKKLGQFFIESVTPDTIIRKILDSEKEELRNLIKNNYIYDNMIIKFMDKFGFSNTIKKFKKEL